MDTQIKDKIRKLLNLANDKGATEDEAQTALKIASGLMARHGIDSSSLGPDRPKINKKMLNRPLKNYQTVAATAAAILYGCQILTYQRGKAGIEFIGRIDNIDAAEDTMLWLLNQIENLYKNNLPPGLTQAHRQNFRRTFKEACAMRVWQRAHATVNELQNNNALALEHTTHNAVVVKDYFQRLNQENNDYLKSSGRTFKTYTTHQSRGSGTHSGYQAGEHVQLRKNLS